MDSKAPARSEPIEPEVEPPSSLPNGDDQDEQSAGRTTAELTVTSFQFSGPLPHPSLLKAYDDTFAGCAERIVAMAERQAQHRQDLEKAVVNANCHAQLFGQCFAFILSLVVICAGAYLLANGKSLQGFSAIILAVGSLIGALVFSRKEQKEERAKKLGPMPSTGKPRSRKKKKK